MKNLIISPYSKILPTGQHNAKNYPYWSGVVNYAKADGWNVVQVGARGEPVIPGVLQLAQGLSFKDLLVQVQNAQLWISVDNFFPHFCAYYQRPGVVIFGKSDPRIFGYACNLNLYRDESYFRTDQFAYWYDEPFDPEVFLSAEEVWQRAKTFFCKLINR